MSVLSTRFQTPVLKRNTNPVYPAKDATFDFPIYLSLADKLGVVELVVWDKDMLKKEYLGEVALPLDDWFRDEGVYAFEDPHNRVWVGLPPTLIVLTFSVRVRHSLSILYLRGLPRTSRALYKSNWASSKSPILSA